MYVPRLFRNEDEEDIKNFLSKNSFGILVSSHFSEILATHIPLELAQNKNEEWVLQGHIAKGNPQWKQFEKSKNVLAIFNGPHSYVSSSWYEKPNVPTWNYIAVHIKGQIRILDGDEFYDSLKHLVDKYEQYSTSPVSMETMPEEMVKREMRGIVGFEIRIETIEAKKKLSQNRNSKDHNNIITELENRNDAQSSAVAEEMKKVNPKGK